MILHTLLIFAQGPTPPGITPTDLSGKSVADIFTAMVIVPVGLIIFVMFAVKSIPVLDKVMGIASGAAGSLFKRSRGGIKKHTDDQNSWLGGMRHRSKEDFAERGFTPGTILGSLNAGRKATRLARKKNRREGVSFRQAARGYREMRMSRATHLGATEAEKNLHAAGETGDDVGHALAITGEHGTQQQLQDALIVKEPQRYLHEELDKDKNDLHRAIYDRQVEKAKAKGQTFDQDEFNKDLRTRGGLGENGKNRQALNSSMALANDVRGKMGGRAATLLGARKVAGSSTGFYSEAEMLKMAVNASGGAHGNDDLMLNTITDLQNRANQAGMYGFGKGSTPEMFLIMKEMQEDMEKNRPIDVGVKGEYNKKINRAARNKMGAYDFAQQHRSSAAHMMASGVLSEEVEETAATVEAHLRSDPGTRKYLAQVEQKLIQDGIHAPEIEQAQDQLLKIVQEKGTDHADVQPIKTRIEQLMADQRSKTPDQARQIIVTKVQNAYKQRVKDVLYHNEDFQKRMADYSSVYENLRAGSRDVREYLAEGTSDIILPGTKLNTDDAGISLNDALSEIRENKDFTTYHNRMREYAVARGAGGRPVGMSEAEWAAMSEEAQRAAREAAAAQQQPPPGGG